MNVGNILSKAIKEGKWVNISYLNKFGENTFYWVAIQDIEPRNRNLKVTMFNDKKSLNTLETWISFDNIKSAEIINFSTYDVPSELIEKIENNLSRYQWLGYDKFNYNILNYYSECNLLDNDPSQKEYTPIPGIDINLLRKHKKIQLNDEQIKKIIRDIYHYDLKKNTNTVYTLAMNCFSISDGKNKYVICYYQLRFNPQDKTLAIDKNLRFNKSFLIEDRRHSLFNYINMDVDEFTRTFVEKYQEYHAMISENLRPGERIDSMPDVMLLAREVPVNLAETFQVIERKYQADDLPVPLKSFFGNITKRNNIRRKEPALIINDRKININQLRVLYNAMKYPVTYVQGPPGTGKTQTIINVVLSGFYNDKTMLICSSNNRPVDGIIEKLKFRYHGDVIDFPFLRLGNFDDVKKATLKIRELYEIENNQKPKEFLLNRIKDNTNTQNAELIDLLNKQERRVDIENCLESSRKLIHSFTDNESGIIQIVKDKISQLQKDLKQLPEITNEQVTSLFEPLEENYQLSQFLYFKSLQYIYNLKRNKYKELIEICYINDDDERALEFNKWTQNDNHMKMLLDVFPVIFSTNISSRRLGSPELMFDLVIMDESGQCNVATALIPITKAESLLLVGDPNQLKPVIILEDEVNEKLLAKYHVPKQYNYKTHSILDVMVESDNISKYILLKYHYRCGKKIINFANQRYYNNTLNLEFLKNEGALELIDVKNQNVKHRNEAYEEAEAIVNYLKRNKIDDAFVITPFVNQKELIQNLLQQNGLTDIACGTIHSLQGAEKSTIIFSPAISLKTSKKTFEWIKNNYELINVAITRAKNKLVIAADTEAVDKQSDRQDDLYNLINYAKNNGEIIIPANESVKIEIGNSNGSEAEDEFYKTISHFCSCYKYFEAERNVKIWKLFKSEIDSHNANLEFDLVLYKKYVIGKKPIIAFEVNGGEHLGISARENSDRRKMQICQDKGIKLIFISNSFVKAYEYIADIIIAAKSKNTSIQQTMFD